jgi:hypothetical protein
MPSIISALLPYGAFASRDVINAPGLSQQTHHIWRLLGIGPIWFEPNSP